MTETALRRREWLERARVQAAVVQQWRDDGERERGMPQPLFEALREAGFFQLAVPRALGGAQLDDETILLVLEELARQDGAAGWNVMIAANGDAIAAGLPEPAAREIYRGGPSTVLAGSLRSGPRNLAVPVEGGYRVSGRWPLASGCQQADWLGGLCLVLGDGMGDGHRRPRSGGLPKMRLCFLPAGDCQILDTWQATGLRGTGSHDFRVTGAVVPGERTLPVVLSDPGGPGVFSMRSFTAHAAPQVAAVALGIARDAIDSLKALVTTKTPHGGTSRLAAQQTVQMQVGRAEALVRSARAYLYESVRALVQQTAGSDAVGEELRAEIRLAAAHVTQSAADAVDLMFAAGGASSIYAGSRLDRCFRDIHVLTQHVQVSPANIEMAGQYFLGLGLQIGR